MYTNTQIILFTAIDNVEKRANILISLKVVYAFCGMVSKWFNQWINNNLLPTDVSICQKKRF